MKINYIYLLPQSYLMATHSSTLPGKSHGQSSLAGYSPWGRKESDMTEQLHFTLPNIYYNSAEIQKLACPSESPRELWKYICLDPVLSQISGLGMRSK